MVSIRTQVDDVLLATSGKQVQATDTVRVSVPAVGSPDGGSKRLTFDVSHNGRTALRKMVADAEAATLAAWAPVLALQATRDQAAGRLKKKPAQKPAAPAEDAGPSDDGGGVVDEPTETPAGSGVEDSPFPEPQQG